MGLSSSKKLCTLLREKTSKHHGDFYFFNCRHSFKKDNKVKSQVKVCKNKDFYGIAMSSEKDTILESNQYMKSEKIP